MKHKGLNQIAIHTLPKTHTGSNTRTKTQSKLKRIQKRPNLNVYKTSLLKCKTTESTNYSIRSNAHNLTVQKQKKLAWNPFDDKRMYLFEKPTLPWEKHLQSGYCPCVLCMLFIRLSYKKLSENYDGSKRINKELYWFMCHCKEKFSHQQFLILVSDCTHLLYQKIFLIFLSKKKVFLFFQSFARDKHYIVFDLIYFYTFSILYLMQEVEMPLSITTDTYQLGC